jgi:hypothetical protein
MAAGNFTFYNTGKLYILDGTIDLDADTISAVLLDSGYTPDATHDTYSDISSDVIADSGYAPQTLANKAVTNSSGTIKFDSDDVSFGSNVSLTAKYIVLVQQAGGSLTGTDKLIGYADLDSGGGSVSSTNSTFQVTVNASGWFTAA